MRASFSITVLMAWSMAGHLAIFSAQQTLSYNSELFSVGGIRLKIDDDPLDEKLKIILDRQKGNRIKLYLNSNGAYVNGKPVSKAEFKTIVKKTELKNVELTVESDVAARTVGDWMVSIKENGVTDVTLGIPKRKKTKAESSKELLSRIDGRPLKIYLVGESLHVNGRQVSLSTLIDILPQTKLKEAILSFDPSVPANRVESFKEQLSKLGFKVELDESPRFDLSKFSESIKMHIEQQQAKVRTILSRQKDERLRFYLNDKGTYINGKSIKKGDLIQIVEHSGLKTAEIKFESYLDETKIAQFEEELRQLGVNQIEKLKKE